MMPSRCRPLLMGALTAAGMVLVSVSQAHTLRPAPDAAHSLTFFAPDVSLTASELARLEDGEVVVRMISSRGPNVAVFVAGRVQATGDRLVARVSEIAEFRRGPMVLAIRRFSSPPRLDDLQGLELDEGQLEDLRRCRVGSCNLKLGADEIGQLQGVMARAGDDWRPAAQAGFRAVVLNRVETYLLDGPQGLPDYVDQQDPLSLAETFREMLALNRFMASSAPDLTRHLLDYPSGSPGIASFLYWAQEQLGRKPVVSATHVNIQRGDPSKGQPEVLIASRQVFALHYLNASLGFTAFFRPDPMQTDAYMAYVNRSSVDGLTGLFGGIRRSVVERRMRNETADVFRTMLARLEAP